MTDKRLRELERRFRESGSVDDESVWLLARVNAGLVRHLHAHLAQWFCHEASCKVYGFPDQNLNPGDIERQWGKSLIALIDGLDDRMNAQFCVKLLTACYLTQHQGELGQDEKEALGAVLTWLGNPTKEQSSLVSQLHQSGHHINPAFGVWDARNPPDEMPEAAALVSRLAQAHSVIWQASIAFRKDQDRMNHLRFALSNICDGGNKWLYANREEVGTYLAPWLLNYSHDPLLEELDRRLNRAGP